MASPASYPASAACSRHAAAAGAQQRHATTAAAAAASPQAAGDGRHARVKKGGVMKRLNFSIIPARVFSDSRVTLRHMRVLGAICRFLNDSNTCHPSLESIGKVCAMPRERVSNITRELVSLGYILKTSGGGREKATEYTVLFDAAAPETLTNSDNVSAHETLTNSDNVSAHETLTNSDNVSDLSTDLSTSESSSVNGNLSTDLSTGTNNPTDETLTGLALNVVRFGTKNVDQIGQPKRYLSEKKRVPARASARLSRTQARAVAPAGAGVRGADAPPQNKISRFSEKAEIETGGKVNGRKAPEESKKTISLADLLGTPGTDAAAAAAAAVAAPAAPARKADAPASRAPASTKNTSKKPAIRAPGERTQPTSHTPTLPTKKRAKTPKKGILAPAPSDVPSDVFAEWQALRRANRAGCGAVAVAEAREEARRAGVDFATFLKAWILSGYKGYTAETYRNGHKNEAANDDDARRIAYEREAAERRRQHDEMMSKAVSYEDFLARHPEYAAKRAAKK